MVLDPVAFQLGPVAVRWYGLAYSAGMLFGWLTARWLVDKQRFWSPIPVAGTPEDVDAGALLAILGVVAGGRLGHVLFYDPAMLSEAPLDVFKPWRGGMSFHGGAIGAAALVALYVWRRRLPVLSGLDLLSCVVPAGLFFGRIANFINGEVVGRVTDVPWAVVFPGAGPEPRHPSQLYEAGCEGLALAVVMLVLVRSGGLGRAGLASGVFCVGYAAARMACEFLREPDYTVPLPATGVSMTIGQVLCLPLLVFGLWQLRRALAGRAPAPMIFTGV